MTNLLQTLCSNRAMWHTLLIFLGVLCSGCTSLSTAAEREPIDCSIARPDYFKDSCLSVRYASEFGDQCISAAAFSDHSCLVLDRDARFCPSEPRFPLTVILDRNDTSLDCAGGIIDHGHASVSSGLANDPVTSDPRRFPGIHAPSDRSLNNIAIRNCSVERTGHMGINLSRFFGGQLSTGTQPQGHHNITIEDVTIRDVITGVYIGNYSENITLNRVTIDHTQRIAVYSEAGSHDIVISDSVIANNQSREAVALDSTYDSTISDTLFLNNREGALNLYQNCGELKGIVCPVERSTPPNNNRILNNTFDNNSIAGLQIASRQGRKHSTGWCQSLNGLAGQFKDTAENNRVQGNRFRCQSGTALRVMDGPNLIIDNTIQAEDQCIPLEISHGRFADAGPELLQGLELRNNTIESKLLPRLRNIDQGVMFEE